MHLNSHLRRIRSRAVMAIALVTSLSSTANGMESQSVHTEYAHGEYRLTMEVILNAPADRVQAVLRDYAQYDKLDPRILESRVIAHPQPDEFELYTRIHACFALLCRNVDRVETVKEGPMELLATVIPAKSDAKRGSTHTVLIADGNRTRVHYTTYIVPKFWVPALFGRSIMLHTLRDATLSMFEHIEKMAQ